MKQTVSFYEFASAFASIRPDNFSRDGLSVLFDYIEQYEDDVGEELVLDVIAICCDFSEDDANSIADQYSIDLENASDPAEVSALVKDYLENEGSFVGEAFEDASGLVTFVYRTF